MMAGPKKLKADYMAENEELHGSLAVEHARSTKLERRLADDERKVNKAVMEKNMAEERLRQVREAILLMTTIRYPMSSMDYRCDPYYTAPEGEKDEEPEELRALRYLYKLTLGEKL